MIYFLSVLLLLEPPIYEIIEHADSAVVSNVSLNQEQISRLKQIFLSDETYEFDFTKEAIFIPSAVVVFQNGEERVEATVSFHAEQIILEYGDKRILLDCDPGIDALKRFVERL